MEKKWTNQYIKLIKNKPDLILCSDTAMLGQDEIKVFSERLAKFKKVYCEIGSGSGEHLLWQAANNQGNLYVGLELRFKRLFRTAEKAEALGLKNLIVLRHDARSISMLFHPGRLSGIFINFPDPWTGKRRWEKHRLLNDQYISTLENLLEKSGFISYKTDHRERFLQICDILKASNMLNVLKFTEDLITSEFYSGNAMSEFERLFMKKKLPIHFVYAEKV